MPPAAGSGHGSSSAEIDSSAGINGLMSIEQAARALPAEGVPTPDALATLPLVIEVDRLVYAKKVISAMRPGLTHYVIHPAKDTPEMRALTPGWPARVGDSEIFKRPDLKDHLRSEGILRIGDKTLASLIAARDM